MSGKRNCQFYQYAPGIVRCAVCDGIFPSPQPPSETVATCQLAGPGACRFRREEVDGKTFVCCTVCGYRLTWPMLGRLPRRACQAKRGCNSQRHCHD